MLRWIADTLLQLFYFLPDLAAILLIIVGVVALVPEIQQRLTRHVRVVLFFLLCTIAIGGVVSSRIQISHQEEKARLERQTMTAQITQLLNDQSETRKESGQRESTIIKQAETIQTLAKQAINEVTGGDSFCYFTAVPNMGRGNPRSYPVNVWVRGRYPIQQVVATIQTLSSDPIQQLSSMRQIPLGNGTLLPGVHSVDMNFTVPEGKHIIQIWSRRGLLTQTLNLILEGDDLRQIGDVWGDGKKIRRTASAS